MSRTLLFCTSYAESQSSWVTRYRVWLNAILTSDISRDHILLVDDASPTLPDWPELRVITDLTRPPKPGSVSLFRFDKRLGRQGTTVYPGWYRSFCLAARFADRYGFDRAVHIES